VTIRFEERGPQETEITLHHVGFPSQRRCDDHEAGWTGILETLAAVAQRTDARVPGR
jgi:uncharacterized protein YndB with AHSA1/START domain